MELRGYGDFDHQRGEPPRLRRADWVAVPAAPPPRATHDRDFAGRLCPRFVAIENSCIGLDLRDLDEVAHRWKDA